MKDITRKLLDRNDAAQVLDLYSSNPEYFVCCPPFPDIDSVISDISSFPDTLKETDKRFYGYYLDEELVAVMDLLYGYPAQDILWIGLLMVRKEYQKQGIASSLISELIESSSSYASIRLAYMNDNHQAGKFWLKRGFTEIEYLDDKTIMELKTQSENDCVLR